MTREQRLRRVALLCCHFTRNLAYYRSGWSSGQLLPTSEFWATVNGNFLNQSVLEWCKLLGDQKGKHFWRSVVANADKFEAGLMRKLGIGNDQREAFCKEMRTYRDRFVAHLDSDLTMHIPKLELGKSSVTYYYTYLTQEENNGVTFLGLPASIDTYYSKCESDSKNTYSALRQT